MSGPDIDCGAAFPGKGGQVVGVEGILFAIVQCVHDEMSNTDVGYEANRVGRGGRRGGQRGVCPTASGCVCRGKTGTFGRSLLACHASRGGRAIPKPPFPNPHFCTFRSGFRAGPERICRLESGGRGSDGGRDGAGLGQGGPEQERAQARRPSDRAIPRQELKLGSFTVFSLSSVDMGSDCSGQKCCCFPLDFGFFGTQDPTTLDPRHEPEPRTYSNPRQPLEYFPGDGTLDIGIVQHIERERNSAFRGSGFRVRRFRVLDLGVKDEGWYRDSLRYRSRIHSSLIPCPSDRLGQRFKVEPAATITY
eukprot:1944925-Rhodomonas_salina.2